LAKQVSKFDKKSRRLRERLPLALPARVSARDSGGREWTEMTRLVDVTPFGARLRLSRPVDIGHLVQLIMAMPRALRAFDHAEDQYRVWAMVRNVRLLEQKTPKDSLVEIGVAFIGKRPPPSYEQNPLCRYSVAQTALESQFWAAQEHQVPALEIEDYRKETRQLIPVDLLMEVFEGDKLVNSEYTVTENISNNGAEVFTTLELKPGTFVKLSSDRYNVVVLAVVRERRVGADNIARLHLEFVGSEWPL
jgi:hypothetical protein